MHPNWGREKFSIWECHLQSHSFVLLFHQMFNPPTSVSGEKFSNFPQKQCPAVSGRVRSFCITIAWTDTFRAADCSWSAKQMSSFLFRCCCCCSQTISLCSCLHKSGERSALQQHTQWQMSQQAFFPVCQFRAWTNFWTAFSKLIFFFVSAKIRKSLERRIQFDQQRNNWLMDWVERNNQKGKFGGVRLTTMWWSWPSNERLKKLGWI